MIDRRTGEVLDTGVVDPDAQNLTEAEQEAEQTEYAYPVPMRWVRLESRWYENLKLEEAAEEAGTIVFALFPVLLALGAQRGPYSAARVDLNDLARLIHAHPAEVRRGVDACIRSGVVVERRQNSAELVHVAAAIGNPFRPTVTPAMRAAVLLRDGYWCGICRSAIRDGEDMHIDHIMPLARGGSNELENLQPSHAVCNRVKGARL